MEKKCIQIAKMSWELIRKIPIYIKKLTETWFMRGQVNLYLLMWCTAEQMYLFSIFFQVN